MDIDRLLARVEKRHHDLASVVLVDNSDADRDDYPPRP